MSTCDYFYTSRPESNLSSYFYIYNYGSNVYYDCHYRSCYNGETVK